MPTAIPNAAGGRGTALSGAASKSYSVVGYRVTLLVPMRRRQMLRL